MSDDASNTSLPGIIVGLAMLYFVPFVAVFIDEVIFGTQWLLPNSPGWIVGAFQIVYWPLIWVWRQFI